MRILRWPVAGPVVVMVLVLLCPSCVNGAQQSIDRSNAAVLVPEGQWRDGFDFSAPPGTADVYEFRWNFRPGVTDVVTGWQVPATQRVELADVPDGDPASEALRASVDNSCPIVDNHADLRFCLYQAPLARDGVNAYLIRSVGDRLVVVEYINIDGRRSEYNDAALEVEYLLSSMESVPLEAASDRYLDTSY